MRPYLVLGLVVAGGVVVGTGHFVVGFALLVLAGLLAQEGGHE